MKSSILILLSLFVSSVCFGSRIQLVKSEDFVAGAKAFADESFRHDNIKAIQFGIFVGVITEKVSFSNNEVFTVPRSAKLNQILSVVSNYVIRNPKDWHLHPGTLSLIALMEAFPFNKAEAEAEQKRVKKIRDENEAQYLKD